MVTKSEKKTVKRASKGKRKHIRLIKQEARKENISEEEIKKRVRAVV